MDIILEDEFNDDFEDNGERDSEDHTGDTKECITDGYGDNDEERVDIEF